MRIENNQYHQPFTDHKLTKSATQVTEEEKQLMQMQKREQELERQKKIAEQLKREAEAAKEQVKAEEDALNIYATCLEIARRISSGDKVPTKDHQFLIKHNPALYGKALTMRIPKEDPKEYKQLSEDEESQNKVQPGISEEISKPTGQDNSSSKVDIKI